MVGGGGRESRPCHADRTGEMKFRNVDVDELSPVETWPHEALRAALERGSLHVWRRLATAIKVDPWGPVARGVEDVLAYSRPYGVTEVMRRLIAGARAAAEATERREVAATLRALVEGAGLTKEEFASRLGTSASRFSTYLSGKVMPSAALLVRARRVASSRSRSA